MSNNQLPIASCVINGKNNKMFVLSGGFDEFVSLTDIYKNKKISNTNIPKTLSFFTDIIQKPMTAPYVYSITNNVKTGLKLISLETGNVLGFYDDFLSKPSFCIEGHTFKVIRRLTYLVSCLKTMIL